MNKSIYVESHWQDGMDTILEEMDHDEILETKVSVFNEKGKVVMKTIRSLLEDELVDKCTELLQERYEDIQERYAEGRAEDSAEE